MLGRQLGSEMPEFSVKLALSKTIGAYGIIVMCNDVPNQLIAARKGSPVIIGIGNDEYFISSDE